MENGHRLLRSRVMSVADAGWFASPLILQGGGRLAGTSRDDFFDFCRRNPDVRMERNAVGDLIIMTPAGSESGRKSGEAFYQLTAWSKSDGSGITFDASAGFGLPKGGERSPDASWIRRERWDALTEAERNKFAPLAPDFVIEVRSESERLPQLREKMQEYADNGVRLGWLIDPIERQVEIYRPGAAPIMLDNPTHVSGTPELSGFTLELAPIW